MKNRLIIVSLSLLAFSSNLFAEVSGELSSLPEIEGTSDSNWSGMLGVTALSGPEYVGGKDSEGAGLPLIIVDYNDTVYFHASTFGVWLWKPKASFRFGLTAISRQGWEDGDGPLLAGRADRDGQVEAGINLIWKINKLSIEGMYLSASSKSEGNSTHIKADYLFHASAKWVVVGGVHFESLDKDIVNFYYGTDGTELPGDSVYTGKSATNTYLSFTAIHNINKEWVAMGGFKATSLGSEIKNSPLVEDDSYNTIFAGIAWKF